MVGATEGFEQENNMANAIWRLDLRGRVENEEEKARLQEAGSKPLLMFGRGGRSEQECN